MTVERRGPLTYGQLSVLRSLEVYGPTGQAVANLVSIWEVPGGVGVLHTVAAWHELVRAHESLRTGYGEGRDGLEQIVHAFQPLPVPVVELAEGSPSEVAQVAASWAAEPMALDTAVPWKAFVATWGGDAVYFVTIIHHIAADNGAVRIMERQFAELVAGGDLEPQPQPVDLALTQQNDARIDKAVEYWTGQWARHLAEDRYPGDTSPRRRAMIYSLDGMRAAEEISRRLNVSVQAVVLAAGSLALLRTKRRNSITFGLMTANRLEEPWASMVSSLNQCAPLTLLVDADMSPSDFIDAVYRQSLNSYFHGHFDVDALSDRLNEEGVPETNPTHFSLHYNFLGKGDGEPAPDSPLRTSVQWRGSRQRIGPYFHLRVAAETGLLIGVGASEDYLPGRQPAVLAASVEAALVEMADMSVQRVADLSFAPLRDISQEALPQN
jgi:hypothetical protein